MTSKLSKPTKKIKAYEDVVAKVKGLILKGKYKPGELLPSERELAAWLSVGRPSVREALKVLDAMGFIEIKVGDGTYVQDTSFSTYLDSVIISISSMFESNKENLLKLWEVRKVLEKAIVELAADRISDESLEALSLTIREMEQNINNKNRFISAGVRFHRIIAESTKNEILSLMWDSISGLIRRSHNSIYRVARSHQGGLHDHKKILAALKKHDPEASGKAMLKHMLIEEKELVTAFSNTKRNKRRSK